MPFTRTWTADEDDFVRNHYLNTPYKNMASVLHRTERAIRLRRITLNLPPKKKRELVNEHFFDTIETPSQAYLLGLIAGDGWVGQRSCGGYGLRLSLKISDRKPVELLRDNLSPKKTIYQIANQAVLDVRLSKHLFSVLTGYGIIVHRKPKYQIPSSIPKALLPEFILGYFDADGSLSKSKRGYLTWSLCGGVPLLSQVSNLFRDNLNIIVTPCPHTRSDWLHYLWLYSSKKIKKVDAWLHHSGLGLTRKHLSSVAPQ